MKWGVAVCALAAIGIVPVAMAAATVEWRGVTNAALARQNWILKCQGCHRADASGTPETTPAMAGEVAKFLSVEGGRNYLAQVPGVATAAVNDAQLAELLNWMLYRFDAEHVPASFEPYTAAEIARLRKSPLRADAAAVRASLAARVDAAAKTDN